MKGIGMVNHPKEVQQETAYSAVVVKDLMYACPNNLLSVFTQKGS